jgi:signal transduction histidine kinase
MSSRDAESANRTRPRPAMVAGRWRDSMFATTPQAGSRFVVVVTYGLLVLSTVIAFATQDSIKPGAPSRSVLLVGAVLTLAWLVFWTAIRPHWRLGRYGTQIYIGGRVVLAFGLAVINPFYAVFAFTGYIDGDQLRNRRQAQVVIGVTAATLSISQSGGFPLSGAAQWVLAGCLFIVNFSLATAFLHIATKQGQLSESRVVMIGELEETNRRLTEALAENAALHGQLLVQAREAGVVDERQRLAREIHDTIAQGLTGVITQLQAAKQSSTIEVATEHVDRAAQLARDSLDEARRSVHDLTPRQLTHDSLPDALARLVDEWSELHHIPATLQTTGRIRPLHEEIDATLLRVAQESLTNVAKHAAARRVGVTLSFMRDDVTLDVRDDGQGFAVDEAPVASARGGFGIAGMRMRALRVSGVLEVESEPGGGTAVSVRLPAVEHDSARLLDGVAARG